ncbi:hypothetical protein RQP46_003417 [Phenoliferia psychrophenolica]
MAFGIAASRGTALVVSDDRTTKNFAPYLHMCCLFRKSGCPFILRLVKAKEGGWVLKASTSTDVELKQRSVYRCRHAAGMTASQPPVALAPAPATPSLPGPPLPQSTGLFSPVLAPTPPPPTLPAPASASAPLPPDKPKRGPGRPRKIKPPVVSSDDDDDEEENYYKPIKHAVAAIPRPAKIRSSMASSKFTKPAPPPAPGTEGFDREKILAPPFQRSISISALIVPALSPNVNAGRIEKAPVLREKPKPDQRPPAPDAFKSFLPPRALAYRPSILGPPPTVSPYNRKADEPPSKTLELWTAFLVALDPSLVIPFAAILSSSTIDVSPEAFFGEGVEMRVALINELKGVGQWAIVRLRSKVVARGEDVWRTISNSEPRAAGSDEIASVGVKVDRKGKGREIVQDEAPPASNGPVPMDLDQSAALQLSPPQATPFTFPFELVPEDQPPPPASTTPKPILPAADSPAATQPVDDEFLVRLRPSEPKPPALSIGRTPSPSDEPDFSEVEVEVDPSLDGEEIDLDGAVVEQLAGDEEAMDTGESSGNESPAQDGDTDGSALVITSAVASPTEATPTGLAGALESVVFRATRERKRKAEMESPALVKAKKAAKIVKMTYLQQEAWKERDPNDFEIAFVPDDDETRLRWHSISLVSKEFRELAIPYIFKVRFSPSRGDTRPSHDRSLEDTFSFVLPGLVNLRSVRFTYSAAAELFGDFPDGEIPDENHRLRLASFGWFGPKLSDLELDSCTPAVAATLLRSCPALQSLKYAVYSFMEYVDKVNFLDALSSLTNLENLTLISTDDGFPPEWTRDWWHTLDWTPPPVKHLSLDILHTKALSTFIGLFSSTLQSLSLLHDFEEGSMDAPLLLPHLSTLYLSQTVDADEEIDLFHAFKDAPLRSLAYSTIHGNPIESNTALEDYLNHHPQLRKLDLSATSDHTKRMAPTDLTAYADLVRSRGLETDFEDDKHNPFAYRAKLGYGEDEIEYLTEALDRTLHFGRQDLERVRREKDVAKAVRWVKVLGALEGERRKWQD